MTLFSRKGNLRDTFIFLFVLIAACPVLILGAVALSVLSATAKNNVTQLETGVLLEKSKIIETYFANARELLRIEVETLTDRSITVSKGVSWQQTFASGIFNAYPAFREVSFVNLQGVEVAKEVRNGATKTLLTIPETDAFQIASRGEDYTSDVSYTLEGPVVRMASPVMLDGKVIQVITAELDLVPLLKDLDDVRLEEGRLHLFDAHGSYVARAAAGSVRPGTDFSSWSIMQQVRNRAVSDEASVSSRYVSSFSGVPVAGAALLVPDSKWSLFIEWPLAIADATVAHVRLEILFVTIASVLVVIVFAVIFANVLAAPIRQLETASRKIAKGVYDDGVTIAVGNELDDLGAAFNHMAQGLKRLDELRKEFVFIAAHELRTPVTAIRGYLSLISEGDGGSVSPALKKLLSPIQDSSDRLIALINSLLMVARSDAGRLEIQTTPLDIRESVRATMRQSAILAKKKKIVVRYEPPAELPCVQGDKERVGEVLLNFISNAIKYTPENGNISISHEIKNGYVGTAVADSGVGISSEDQAHLFEKFFRADSVKMQHIEGTGLGLFITKEMVEKMGGSVSVVSQPQKGSVFSFSLKIADAGVGG